MQDLTTGPVTRHLLKTAGFMLVMMVSQTLYFLVDLYWVGRLGTRAVAAVGIAGNLTFVVLALTQMLGVGTTTVVSHAAGRKDRDEARLLFNQSQVLASAVGLAFLVVAMALRTRYAAAMAPDAETARLAAEYLLWFLPAMGLQFLMVAMGAALRGTGSFRPTMIVSTATVLMNLVLAPALMFGWGTGRPLGVAGTAVATLVAVVVGVVWLGVGYFRGEGALLGLDPALWRPRLALWKRMLVIGLPAGAEFALIAVYMLVVYTVTRPFGPAAQAGFGIGQRVVQATFMPVVALGMSVAPVAGQNFGARQRQRVVDTFRDAAWMAVVGMAILTAVCHLAPDAMIRAFTADPAVVSVGAEYLRIVSWNFVASGLVFVAASMFQAMGNTLPSLATSFVRIVVVALPTLALARRPDFALRWVWYLSVASVVVQLALALWLLRREFGRRLDFAAEPAAA